MGENLKAFVPAMSLSPFLGWLLASNSALASLAITVSALSLRIFGQKPWEEGLYLVSLTVIWIYKLDFSSITPDHPLLSQ